MPNNIAFYILAALTLCSAIAAMALRNMVHCALCAAGAFAGIALVFLHLDAEFAGLAQILVYVGAVAILVLFAVLLTRGEEIKANIRRASRSWFSGVCASALVFAGIIVPIAYSPGLKHTPAATASAPVQKLGESFVNEYVLPLEVLGLLLTAALLGAVVIAMQDKKEETKSISQPENHPVQKEAVQ